MKDSTMEEFLELLAALQNETINGNGVARIEKLALEWPELRQLYVQRVRMISDLQRDSVDGTIERTLKQVLSESTLNTPKLHDHHRHSALSMAEDSGPGSGLRNLPRTSALILTALCVVLTGVVLNQMNRGRIAGNVPVDTVVKATEPQSDTASRPIDVSAQNFVARLTRSADCIWENESHAPGSDTLFCSGQRLKLRTGHVEIGFFNGAMLVAKGPVDLEVKAADSVVLHAGMVRVRANAEAIGFTVLTPQVAVIDMGTEFGVSVDGTGAASVDVFEGQVLAQVVDESGIVQENVPMAEGTAIQFDEVNHAKQRHPILCFEEVDAVETQDAYQRWLSYRESLMHDPGLVAYYTFEHPVDESKELKNHSVRGHKFDGQVVNGQWSEGRWPKKGALSFDGHNSRLLIDIPGDHRDLTMAAWIRPAPSGQVPASLIHSDGHTWDHPGSIHWMIHPRDRLHCAFVDANKRVINSFSSSEITHQRAGGWHHVAVICDMQSGSVSQYIDGRLAGVQKVDHPRNLRIGSAQIGNSSISEPDNQRQYTGKIDEFVILQRSLTAAEIRYMHAMGRPL